MKISLDGHASVICFSSTLLSRQRAFYTDLASRTLLESALRFSLPPVRFSNNGHTWLADRKIAWLWKFFVLFCYHPVWCKDRHKTRLFLVELSLLEPRETRQDVERWLKKLTERERDNRQAEETERDKREFNGGSESEIRQNSIILHASVHI